MGKNIKFFAFAFFSASLFAACSKNQIMHRHYVRLLNGTNQELVVRYSIGGQPMVTYVPNTNLYQHVELFIPLSASFGTMQNVWTKEDFENGFDYIQVHRLRNIKDTSKEFIDIKKFESFSTEKAQVSTSQGKEQAYIYKHVFKHIFP